MTFFILTVWIIIGIWAGYTIMCHYFKPYCYIVDLIPIIGLSIIAAPFTVFWALYLKYRTKIDAILFKRINLE